MLYRAGRKRGIDGCDDMRCCATPRHRDQPTQGRTLRGRREARNDEPAAKLALASDKTKVTKRRLISARPSRVKQDEHTHNILPTLPSVLGETTTLRS